MDEETIEATCAAIAFLGDAALRASSADLVARARSVADHIPAAALALDQVDSEGRMQAVSRLREAATVLEQVESEGRRESVSDLLGAATALKETLGVDLNVLRDAAADLAQQCGQHREATTLMEKVRRVVEEQSHRSAPWWMLWRRRGHRISDVEKGSLTTALQAPEIIVDFLHNEAARTDHLVMLAGDIILSAENLAVPHQSLVAAREALQRAESPSCVKAAVTDLEAGAMGVKGASAQEITLCNPAVQLVAACEEYLKASNAMAVVQRAALERARQRESALVPIHQNGPTPPPPGPALPGQGDVRRSSWLGYALSGSLSLAPYLAATSARPLKHLGDNWACLVAWKFFF